MNKVWREKIFKRHISFASAMAYMYNKEDKKNGYVSANNKLRELEALLKLGKTGLFCDCEDDQIIQYAKIKSKRLEGDFFEMAKRTGSKEAAFKWLEFEMGKTGIELPLDIKDGDSEEIIKKKTIAACARVFDECWWRRKLRTIATRGVETICRMLGLVTRKNGVYVSNFTYRRRLQQQNRNRQLLLSLVAENEDGYSATLADMSDKGISNPVNRHGELMTRARGFEEVAIEAGFTSLFFTLTCPSKYHAVHDNGSKNSKYNGATPRDAQDYLCKVWSRIRASWDRKKIKCYGFRVAEPHQDGTPHWHLMLFFAPDSIESASSIFTKYALKEDGHENGADKYRSKIVVIDPSKGSAAGYLAKYIAKNIPGLDRSEEDHEAQDKTAVTAERVEAWASCWGIRQFQQIGSISVTVWREMRRIRKPLEDASLEELEAIRMACDVGDWAEFVRLMGGPLVPRKEHSVKTCHDEGEENKYGEMIERIQGVIMRGVGRYVTRIHQWTISRANKPEVSRVAVDAEKRAFFIRHGPFALGP